MNLFLCEDDMGRIRAFCLIGPAIAVSIAAACDARAGQAAGRFVHVSDIHFDPFNPPGLARNLASSPPDTWQAKFAALPDQPMSSYESDTNHALLSSALAAIAGAAREADFAIVTGDLLAHRFEEETARTLAVQTTSDRAQAFATATTVYVAEALGAAFAGKPVIVALGNNDSSCGDYEIEPAGRYLAATKDVVRRLAGNDRVEPDFDQTYALGGFYAVRHPTVTAISILVLNDILWSTKYRNACGSNGSTAAKGMMDWLTERLRQAKKAGSRVWLVHHIPVGIDPYSTAHAKATICAAKVTPYLNEPFASQYLGLLREFKEVIQASFAGHVHFDDYRLLLDDSSNPIGLEKIAPAISPIFGQNPGFHMFTYDLRNGAPSDFSTIFLANLAEASNATAGDWRVEYTFTQAYRQPRYGVETVAAMWNAVSKPGPLSDIFRRLYDVSRGELGETTLKAYTCAIDRPDPKSYAACYCP
jgi:sphingomyelin phosphodiesterase acid-like 3